MRELIIKKCSKCNNLIKVFDECKCAIKCCDEEMKTLKANDSDGAAEKHVPTYEVKDGTVYVEVKHVMEDDHYIEWIAAVSDLDKEIKYLKPGNDAKAEFKYVEGMTLYSYCNKHSLWKTEVK